MSERKPGLTDREALKVMFYGFLGLASLPLQYKLLRSLGDYARENEFSYLERNGEVQSLPYALAGVHFNAPFLWKRTPEEIRAFYEFARSITGHEETDRISHTVRVFPEDAENFIENKLGKYNTGQLDMLERFFDSMPPDFQAILPIMDGFWLFRSDIKIFIYESAPLSSPYLADTSSSEEKLRSQIGFFTHADEINAFQERMSEFIRRFGARENVILEVMNEGAVPLRGEDGLAINTFWYREMIRHAREEKYLKTLLTGVAYPDQIDYAKIGDTTNIITTHHPYFPQKTDYPENVRTIVEEVGAPHEIFKVDLPQADGYLSGLVTEALEEGVTDGISRIGSIILWHADWKHTFDHMDFRPEYFPKTAALLRRLSPKLKEVFAGVDT